LIRVAGEFEKLAYDAALRGLDKQEGKIRWLTRAYTVAAGALVIEILSLAALLGGNIF
jgi:hypothetical protein